MVIKILGSGCKKCKKIEENARQAIRQLSGNSIIEKVTDLNQIMNYGVMITPALGICKIPTNFPIDKISIPEHIEKIAPKKWYVIFPR